MRNYEITVTAKIEKKYEIFDVLVIKSKEKDIIIYQRNEEITLTEEINTITNREQQIKEIVKKIKRLYSFEVETVAYSVYQIK